MKRKKINRPHWKKLAEKRNRIIRSLHRALYKARKQEKAPKPVLNSPLERGKGLEVSKRDRLATLSMEKESLEMACENLRQNRDELERRNVRRQQRRELLQPALDLINKLLED